MEETEEEEDAEVDGEEEEEEGIQVQCCFTSTETTRTVTMQYNTIQLYCLCVEKFAFWLVVIYIKHSIYLTTKRQQLNETRS